MGNNRNKPRQQRDAYPEVVPAVDIPLHHVVVPLGEVGLEAVRVADPAALLVAGLLVFLVMAMLRVELRDHISGAELASTASGADPTKFPSFPILCLGAVSKCVQRPFRFGMCKKSRYFWWIMWTLALWRGAPSLLAWSTLSLSARKGSLSLLRIPWCLRWASSPAGPVAMVGWLNMAAGCV